MAVTKQQANYQKKLNSLEKQSFSVLCRGYGGPRGNIILDTTSDENGNSYSGMRNADFDKTTAEWKPLIDDIPFTTHCHNINDYDQRSFYSDFINPNWLEMDLPKTYLTRRGEMMLFVHQSLHCCSLNKQNKDETQGKWMTVKDFKHQLTSSLPNIPHGKVKRQPTYEEFVNFRPGYSPVRYLASWSRLWSSADTKIIQHHDSLIEKHVEHYKSLKLPQIKTNKPKDPLKDILKLKPPPFQSISLPQIGNKSEQTLNKTCNNNTDKMPSLTDDIRNSPGDLPIHDADRIPYTNQSWSIKSEASSLTLPQSHNRKRDVKISPLRNATTSSKKTRQISTANESMSDIDEFQEYINKTIDNVSKSTEFSVVQDVMNSFIPNYQQNDTQMCETESTKSNKVSLSGEINLKSIESSNVILSTQKFDPFTQLQPINSDHSTTISLSNTSSVKFPYLQKRLIGYPSVPDTVSSKGVSSVTEDDLHVKGLGLDASETIQETISQIDEERSVTGFSTIVETMSISSESSDEWEEAARTAVILSKSKERTTYNVNEHLNVNKTSLSDNIDRLGTSTSKLIIDEIVPEELMNNQKYLEKTHTSPIYNEMNKNHADLQIEDANEEHTTSLHTLDKTEGTADDMMNDMNMNDTNSSQTEEQYVEEGPTIEDNLHNSKKDSPMQSNDYDDFHPTQPISTKELQNDVLNHNSVPPYAICKTSTNIGKISLDENIDGSNISYVASRIENKSFNQNNETYNTLENPETLMMENKDAKNEVVLLEKSSTESQEIPVIETKRKRTKSKRLSSKTMSQTSIKNSSPPFHTGLVQEEKGPTSLDSKLSSKENPTRKKIKKKTKKVQIRQPNRLDETVPGVIKDKQSGQGTKQEELQTLKIQEDNTFRDENSDIKDDNTNVIEDTNDDSSSDISLSDLIPTDEQYRKRKALENIRQSTEHTISIISEDEDLNAKFSHIADARARKRAVAAEKRRQDVERRRLEKDLEKKLAQDRIDREEQLKLEADNDKKRWMEERQRKKEQEESEIRKQKEEEENRQLQILRKKELERKAREEKRMKLLAIAAERKLEEELRNEKEVMEQRIEKEMRAREQALLLQLEEKERIEYEKQLKEEEEIRKLLAEQLRKEEEIRKIQAEEDHERLMKELHDLQRQIMERNKKVKEMKTNNMCLGIEQKLRRAFTYSYYDKAPCIINQYEGIKKFLENGKHEKLRSSKEK